MEETNPSFLPTSSSSQEERASSWLDLWLPQLTQLSKLQSSAKNFADFCAGVHQALESWLPATRLMVAVINPEDEQVSVAFSSSPASPPVHSEGAADCPGTAGEAESDRAESTPTALNLIFSDRVGEHLTKAQLISFVTENPCASDNSPGWVWMAEPLMIDQDQWLGAIVVAAYPAANPYTPAQQELFRFVAGQAGLALWHFQARLVEQAACKRSVGELQVANARLAYLTENFETTNAQLSLISEMDDILHSCQALDEAFAVVSDFAPRIFAKQPGALFMLDSSESEATAVATWGAPHTRLLFKQEECWSLRRGRVHRVSNTHSRLRCAHILNDKNTIEASGYACFPLAAQGQLTGVLYLQAPQHRQPQPPNNAIDLPLAEWGQLGSTVAERLALSLSNIFLREALRQHSVRDPLTGLFHRRYMEETLRREILHADRHKLSVGIIMLDIDYFRKFNATYGHEVGDLLLRELARYLVSSVRGEDVVCRYGGEEFVVILPGATLEDTLRRAEEVRIGASGISLGEILHSSAKDEQASDEQPDRLTGASTYSSILSRYAGEQSNQPTGGSQRSAIEPVFLSLGVAAYPQNGANSEELLRAADRALVQAKAKGRNQVIAAHAGK